MTCYAPARDCPAVVLIVLAEFIPQMRFFVERDKEMKAEKHDRGIHQERPIPEKEGLGRKNHDARTTDVDTQRWRNTFTFTINVPVAPLTCRSMGPEHLLIRGTTFAPA